MSWPWWVPRAGWQVIGVAHDGAEVVVRMGHPEWPEPLFVRAPDEGTAVAWTMLRRNGVVDRKRHDASKPSTTLPPSLRKDPRGSTRPCVRVDLASGWVLRMPGAD